VYNPQRCDIFLPLRKTFSHEGVTFTRQESLISPVSCRRGQWLHHFIRLESLRYHTNQSKHSRELSHPREKKRCLKKLRLQQRTSLVRALHVEADLTVFIPRTGFGLTTSFTTTSDTLASFDHLHAIKIHCTSRAGYGTYAYQEVHI
jgi:hypothetical protein